MEANRAKYYCNVPGCNRSYLRSEHLNRHSLIHKKGAFACYLCQRRFTRNDLLNAHLRRHEKRGHVKEDSSKEPLTVNPPPAEASNSEPESRSVSATKTPESKDWGFDSGRTSQPPPALHTDVLPPINHFQPGIALPPPRTDLPHTPTAYQFPSPNDVLSHNSGSSSHTLLPQITQPPYIHEQGPVDDYAWLFQGGSLFDLPPDDYLNLHFGDNLGPTPPGFYSQPLEPEHGPPEGPGFTISDHERLIRDYPKLMTCPLKDPAQVNTAILLALDYCDVYMPLFHRPTLSLSSCPTPLLLALCGLGTFLSNAPGSYETGKMLQRYLWSQTVEKVFIGPRVEMWFLQTLVLIQHICTYCMARHEHAMAEVVHSIIVTLARRNNLMTENYRTETVNRQSLDVKWREWAQRESVIRIAHTIFVNDVQYMIYFSHHASISVSMMKLPLPSHQALWEASNALEWETQMRQLKRPTRSRYNSLQAAVESLMSLKDSAHKRENLQRFNMLNPFALHILIHGLASAIGDLRYRSVASSSTPATSILVQADFDEALAHWRASFEQLSETERANKFSWVALLMYHFATILLRNNLSEIQMAAGSAWCSGRLVTPQGAQAAYSRLITTGPVTHDSYIHGLEIVSVCLQDLDTLNPVSPSRPPLWQAYCAYLGILVIWAHALGLEKLGCTRVNSSKSLLPLPPTFTSGPVAGALCNMYNREFAQSEADQHEVQNLKREIRNVIPTTSKHLTVTPWDLAHEASRILTALGEREDSGPPSSKGPTLPSMIVPQQPMNPPASFSQA
ncbi:hypothetical protein AJ80_06617 [Polytolypa hystricis UAMH7299]|uniref:C2H2-type domain-containing protein n=1 Tax=Polytolypa hystricis (strain UAMH7299) TaxID=1447883 RepID=A0A2B7XLP5_POLH7|nr:hypothetical protein AJ80_06617 [Polytolypa hystricis UAMH7299]